MEAVDLEKEIHISRYIIIYKLVLGLFETILGLGIILFGDYAYTFFTNFETNELLEDSHTLLANLLGYIIPYLFAYKSFIIFLLLLLGITKVIGAIGLWYKKHWGLDLLVGVTILLLPFEAYHLLIHPSVTKIIYFVINLLIALYLVEFKPKDYFVRFKGRIKLRHKNKTNPQS